MAALSAALVAAPDAATLQFGPDLWWQAALLFVLTVVGSSAGGVIAKQILPSRADRVKVQRDGAAEALNALHAFYLSVYEHRAISRPLTEPEQRLLIGLASQARISTAKTGDTDLRRKVKDFVLTGRRWADGHPGYTAVEVESQYDALLTAMTDFLHRNR